MLVGVSTQYPRGEESDFHISTIAIWEHQASYYQFITILSPTVKVRKLRHNKLSNFK